MTTAKGIAGGLPLAGVTGRAELMDSVHVGGLGGTAAGGNPVACAAGLGSIAEMKEHSLDARALEIGAVIRGRLEKLTAEHPVIADVRGRGAMQAIELCTPGTKDPDAARAAAVSAYCHKSGVVALHLRHVGQRVPLPASPRHLRRAARRGVRRGRGGVRRDCVRYAAPADTQSPGATISLYAG